MLLTILRVLIGFALACLAAAVVQLGFAVPSDLMTSNPDQLYRMAHQVLLTSTQLAVFSAPLAVLVVAVGEWRTLRSAVYYIVSGLVIAGLGLLAVYSGEAKGTSSIVNSYAVAAFLAAGFVGGLVYYLSAGRWAGWAVRSGDLTGDVEQGDDIQDRQVAGRRVPNVGEVKSKG